MATLQARIIHRTIKLDWRRVYDFCHRPENIRHWAAGLANGMVAAGDEWVGDGGPLGTIRVQFTPRNEHGVVDHVVLLPDGTRVYNAMRVTPNGDGAEVMFTLLRQPGMDDAAFAEDAATVARDLETLKMLMETDNG